MNAGRKEAESQKSLVAQQEPDGKFPDKQLPHGNAQINGHWVN